MPINEFALADLEAQDQSIAQDVLHYLDTLYGHGGDQAQKEQGQQQEPTITTAFPTKLTIFLRAQLESPVKIFAATSWCQSKGLNLTTICGKDSFLLATIDENNNRLVQETRARYTIEKRKANHLERIQRLLGKPLEHVFRPWASDPPNPSELALGALSSIEYAIEVSSHLTPEEISTQLNEAVNGFGVSTRHDQKGKKPTQARIDSLCRRLESSASSGPRKACRPFKANSRLRSKLAQKRTALASPEGPVSKRQQVDTISTSQGGQAHDSARTSVTAPQRPITPTPSVTSTASQRETERANHPTPPPQDIESNNSLPPTIPTSSVTSTVPSPTSSQRETDRANYLTPPSQTPPPQETEYDDSLSIERGRDTLRRLSDLSDRSNSPLSNQGLLTPSNSNGTGLDSPNPLIFDDHTNSFDLADQDQGFDEDHTIDEEQTFDEDQNVDKHQGIDENQTIDEDQIIDKHQNVDKHQGIDEDQIVNEDGTTNEDQGFDEDSLGLSGPSDKYLIAPSGTFEAFSNSTNITKSYSTTMPDSIDHPIKALEDGCQTFLNNTAQIAAQRAEANAAWKDYVVKKCECDLARSKLDAAASACLAPLLPREQPTLEVLKQQDAFARIEIENLNIIYKAADERDLAMEKYKKLRRRDELHRQLMEQSRQILATAAEYQRISEEQEETDG